MPQLASDAPLRGGVRPLSAAEVTAVSAGRRLYRADAIGPNATVNTILCHTALLQPRELHALDQIGDRGFTKEHKRDGNIYSGIGLL